MKLSTVEDVDHPYIGMKLEKREFWVEIVERTVEPVDKIRARIKVAQDRQKSYADVRRRDLKFQVGDKVFSKGGTNERSA